MKTLNFAVLKSAFGDYWIGGVELDVNGISVFTTYDEAMDRAIDLTDSISNKEELEQTEEFEVEKIDDNLYKWII